MLRFIHTVRFFLIATAIPLVAANGLYRIQWKCSHHATVTTSPAPIQSIVSKNKSQSQIAQWERAFRNILNHLKVRSYLFATVGRRLQARSREHRFGVECDHPIRAV